MRRLGGCLEARIPRATCVVALLSDVGSLNLQIAIDQAGAVTPALQSPANPEATTCILSGARAWSLPAIGTGTAMVLLSIDEDAPPDRDGRRR
jgi:hypothetical protein